MTTDFKTNARQVREEIWNKKNFGLANQLVGGDCNVKVHDPLTPELGQGPAALQKLVELYVSAFPDARCTVEEVIAEGDRVVVRWNATATNTGKLLQIPPTNKKIDITGVDIYHFGNGKIQDMRVIWDAMRLTQQLGISQ